MTAPTTPPTPAPVPGSDEYNKAMADKATAPSTPPAEQLILGKFKSQDDLVKAYSELEAMLGGKKPEADQAPAPDASKTDGLKVDPTKQAAQDVLARAGLTEEALAAEHAKDGKLSDASYAKLAEQGVPKSMVDRYLAGVRADAAQFESKVHDLAGGKDEFGKLLSWVKTNAPKEQIEAYNAAVDSGNLGQISLALNGFKAAYTNDNPALIGGRGNVGTVGFQSQAEMTAAMRDPRYAKDEAYRETVYAKIAAMK